MDRQFLAKMRVVEAALRDAGFVPFDQLYAYATTGNSAYITRRRGARELVAQMDRRTIKQYLWLTRGE